MSVDPRPYAGPTDLVTAEDVARWLDDRAMASPPEPVPQYSRHWTLELAWAALDERLDRERRQACRRGALAEWRRFSRVARAWRGFSGHRYALTVAVWARDDDTSIPQARARVAHAMLQDLARALAFRAAARQP